MRIFIHDFGAFPYPFELCVWLARQGHNVLYSYFSDRTQARSGLNIPPDLTKLLQVSEIRLGKYDKYNFLAKGLNDIKYGRLMTEVALPFRPDVAISGNTPLDSQAIFAKNCKKAGVHFVYWLQDLIATGIAVALEKKRFPLRALITKRYEMLERKVLKQSDAIVAASEGFIPTLKDWAVWREPSTVINNWCPLDEIHPAQQSNEWSIQNRLAGVNCLLYSGSLGLKHDPDYFIKVARALDVHGATLVMIAEGPGVTWLQETCSREGIKNIRFFDFQPYDRLSEVLASSSILLATNSAAASQFCFPSKVLTYMCAGRPILLASPHSSYMAKLLERTGAGLVADPQSEEELAAHLAKLFSSPEIREDFSRGARAYAIDSFNIDRIGKQFTTVFKRVVGNARTA